MPSHAGTISSFGGSIPFFPVCFQLHPEKGRKNRFFGKITPHKTTVLIMPYKDSKPLYLEKVTIGSLLYFRQYFTTSTKKSEFWSLFPFAFFRLKNRFIAIFLLSLTKAEFSTHIESETSFLVLLLSFIFISSR